MSGVAYTPEEESYIKENWGTVSVGHICEKLGRTEVAILQKVHRMGLPPFLESGEYVTFAELLHAIGYRSTDSYKLISWVKNRHFPMHQKRVNRSLWRIVYIDEFWKWAEKNMDILNFSGFEKNALGKEPDWVQSKRESDIHRSRHYKTRQVEWTKQEDNYLKMLLKQQKYTYDEISEKLQRTIGAIQRRMLFLEIRDRPIKNSTESWTQEETEKLLKMIQKGYSCEWIAEKLGRSTKSIKGKLYRKYKTEKLDEVRKILGGKGKT